MADYTGIPFNAPGQSFGTGALTSGVASVQGRAVLISVTVAGTLTLAFPDGTSFVPSFPVGVFQLNLAVNKVTNGTATATYCLVY